MTFGAVSRLFQQPAREQLSKVGMSILGLLQSATGKLSVIRVFSGHSFSGYPNVANLLRGKTRQSVPDVAARRLGEDGAYLAVRDILSEASTVADGALSREYSGFYRCEFTTLGLRFPVIKDYSLV